MPASLRGANPVAAVSVRTDLDEEVVAVWRELEAFGVFTPYQSLAWYQAWLSNAGASLGETPFIIMAHDDAGQTTLLLPLVTSMRASVRIATFTAGKHANFNMPLLRSGVMFTPASMERLFVLTARNRPDLDLLILSALPQAWDGTTNPLILLNAGLHTTEASVLKFDGDPERSLTHRRQRKLRANDRKFDQLGVTLHRAQSQQDIDRALAAFHAQKASWFLARGLPNSFRDPVIMAFFADLMGRSDSLGELYYLGLPGGKITAVAAILKSRHRASLMFVSFDATWMYAAYSPGAKLIRSIVKDAYRDHLTVFDFGLGEAAYKASMGARLQQSFVEIRPFTMKGNIAAGVVHWINRAKLFVKSHKTLVAMLRRPLAIWLRYRTLFDRKF